MTDHSTFVGPNEFHVAEMIQFNSELYMVLNEKMLPDHFAYRVAAITWDYTNGKWDSKIHRFTLPGHETYRVFGETVRKAYKLSAEPYPVKAWASQLDWHNDPNHNNLP